MPFDLIHYARQHRLRTRNLHDGRPCPPAHNRGASGLAAGFIGPNDREDAIVGRLGYVVAEGDGIIWVLLCETNHMKTARLRRFCHLPGVVVEQDGDGEASGRAPTVTLEAILDAISAYQLRCDAGGTRSEAKAHEMTFRAAYRRRTHTAGQ